MAQKFLDAEDSPRELYAAYGTADLGGAIHDAGHDAMIEPKPLQAPVEGGFTVDDFTVDQSAGTVTCPAGNTRPISKKAQVAAFGKLQRAFAERDLSEVDHVNEWPTGRSTRDARRASAAGSPTRKETVKLRAILQHPGSI